MPTLKNWFHHNHYLLLLLSFPPILASSPLSSSSSSSFSPALPHLLHLPPPLPTSPCFPPQSIATNTKMYFGPDLPTVFVGAHHHNSEEATATSMLAGKRNDSREKARGSGSESTGKPNTNKQKEHNA